MDSKYGNSMSFYGMYWEYEGCKMYIWWISSGAFYKLTNNRNFTGNEGLSSGTYGDEVYGDGFLRPSSVVVIHVQIGHHNSNLDEVHLVWKKNNPTQEIFSKPVYCNGFSTTAGVSVTHVGNLCTCQLRGPIPLRLVLSVQNHEMFPSEILNYTLHLLQIPWHPLGHFEPSRRGGNGAAHRWQLADVEKTQVGDGHRGLDAMGDVYCGWIWVGRNWIRCQKNGNFWGFSINSILCLGLLVNEPPREIIKLVWDYFSG